MPLPIEPLLPQIADALARDGRAVLQAPPGAGKTTRVPLALLDVYPEGRIIMLEPRRLAAKGAAMRLAETLGEPVGKTVGYAMRGDTKVSDTTRIQVVTEGILTRMIQSDPELPGVSCVIFDEFHERSLNADLGLALAWEVRQALRPDLGLLVMSATLDAEPVALMLDNAPILTSEGQSFPVDIKWLPSPRPARAPLAAGVVELVRTALETTEGGILVFLPGEREIRAVQSGLGDLGDSIAVHPLYGALPFAQQQAAIAPETRRRKLVLATSIAETSLTIQDIRVVVDAGLSRRARFDPASGMSRLVTEPASRAEFTQRTGRAGRIAPGTAFRLWAKAEEGARPSFAPPEIASTDLSGLALELAQWGSDDLAFLTPPPEGPKEAARSLLKELGALGPDGRITPHGNQIATLPLHPRLAHMLTLAGAAAAPLAALLSDRDPRPGTGADLVPRLKALRAGSDVPKRLVQESRRLARMATGRGRDLSDGQMAALAYPDRIGMRRPGTQPRYVLSGGRGAVLDPSDGLASAPYIVATNLDGGGREARVRMALSLTELELREVLGDTIVWTTHCEWSRRTARVEARRQERLGSLILSDETWNDALDTEIARAMLTGIRQIGLALSPPARRFQARAMLLGNSGAPLPDFSDDALLADLENWLLPYLTGLRTAGDWQSFDALPALRARLDWDQMQRLDAEVPGAFTTPLGRNVPIDYSGQEPEVAVRLQELFGQTKHPTVAGRPLRLTLLSPAQRPVQVTMDLPRFWATSYADVRKDMRGRYPKHPWPEDPTVADPTLRAKRRGT